jgi:glycerate kinase
MIALCCPDKFRGSLTAGEAAAAMALGLDCETVELPLADGGEGTLDVLGGRRLTARVTGPLGEPVEAEWGLLDDGTAVIEMARASGLALVARNDPLRADTRGTGELLLAARAAGARRAIVTLGGSASTDGGLGAVEALDWRLPMPVTVACDVTTPFVDAARVFGPQKGAGPKEIAALTARLEALRDRYGLGELTGAGAAGGLAGGLAALGATLRSGFDVVAEAVHLDAAIARADLVVTGEGALDRSSLDGKVVGGVLARTPAGRARAVIAGHVAPGLAIEPGVTVRSLTVLAGSPERAIADAAAFVRAAATGLPAGCRTVIRRTQDRSSDGIPGRG